MGIDARMVVECPSIVDNCAPHIWALCLSAMFAAIGGGLSVSDRVCLRRLGTWLWISSGVWVLIAFLW